MSMGADYGPKRTSLAALHFSSPCRARKKLVNPLQAIRQTGEPHGDNVSAGAGIQHAEYNLADARCGLRAILPAGPVTRYDGQHSGLVRRWR